MWSVVLWAAIGGVCLEFMHWYEKRRDTFFPTYARTPRYWFLTIGMVLCGCILAYLLSLQAPISKITALAIGFCAPSLMHKLAKFLPKGVSYGRDITAGAPSARGFLT